MEPPKKLIKLNDPRSESSTTFEPVITQLCLEMPHTFQPTGISYNQGDGKTIIIITGVNEILTFLLGDLKTIVNASGTIKPLKENLIKIKNIKVVHSKLRTYCLHEDRTLSLFKSYKQLKRLKSPVGCHDLIKYKDGVALLVKEPNKNLMIEYLLDTSAPENTPVIDCGPGLDNEQYSLGSVIVTENNHQFLSKFLGVCPRTKKETILMFSVGNNIFWVDEGTGTDDYEIRIVRNCSSKVKNFWLTKAFPMFVVVLVSGVMDVHYLCPVLGLISHKRFYLFENCWCFNMEPNCVYSDGTTLNMIELKQGKKGIEMQRKSIQLPGVTGLIHIKQLNRTFCVTENRCLYQVSAQIEKTHGQKLENRQFLLVDDHFLIKAQSLQKQFLQLFEHYQNCHKSIEESKSRHTLLENYRSKRPSSISFKETLLETIPQNLSSYRHFLTEPFDQGHIFIVLETKKDYLRSCERIETSYIIFEYLEITDNTTSLRKKKRFVRVKDLLREDYGQENEETVKFLFVIRQHSHLYLPEIEISIGHLIQKNNEVLMLRTKVRVEKTRVKHKLVIAREISVPIRHEFRSKDLKAVIDQIMESQDVFSFLKEPGSVKPADKPASLQSIYSFKISGPNINQTLLNNFKLSSTNPRSELQLFGRYATVELKQSEEKSYILTSSSNDVGVLNYLKNFIAKTVFAASDEKDAERWKVGSDCLKSLQEISPALSNPIVKACDIIDLYRKMRDVPLEYIKLNK